MRRIVDAPGAVLALVEEAGWRQSPEPSATIPADPATVAMATIEARPVEPPPFVPRRSHGKRGQRRAHGTQGWRR